MNINLDPLEMQAINLAIRMHNLRMEENVEWHESILEKIKTAYPFAIDEALARIAPEKHERYLTATKSYIDNIEELISAEEKIINSRNKLENLL
ncbi:MAG: hypothetical protein EOP45_03070 [Sphingobacteriaceae bacterium]|nr:MAG: hypothetical protein EOP45_03070 [Sphingobacteriaceae bacterium]